MSHKREPELRKNHFASGQTNITHNFSFRGESGSPVDEIVEDDEHGDGHDGGGEEGVHDEALGVPLDVVGVRAQAGPLKVYGAVRLDGLQNGRVFFNQRAQSQLKA